MLQIGDRMPDFEVMDQDGNKVEAKDLIGRKTIVYFYPKDNTSGCTAEACNIRDNYGELVQAGYNVVGVSKDSAASPSFQILPLKCFRHSGHGEKRRCMERP